MNKKSTKTIDKTKQGHRKTAVSKSKETRSLPSHDKLYRRLFAHPEMVEDLVKTFVKERFVKGVDFSTLKELKNKYVTDENKYRENDIIYEIKIKNETLYFYILLEFQSTVDKFMPVRMLTYIMLFYQDLIKKSAAKKVKLEKLPAVFPILLYNGEDKWSTPAELKDLIEIRYEALEKYIPNFAYYKIIENEFSQESLKELKSISAAMFRLEMAGDEDISKCALRLTKILKKEANPELKRDFRLWLNQLIRGYGIKPKEVDKIIDELEAGKMTLLEATIKKNLKKAEEKGVERIAVKMLLRGDSISEVVEITGLPEDEIKRLKAMFRQAA